MKSLLNIAQILFGHSKNYAQAKFRLVTVTLSILLYSSVSFAQLEIVSPAADSTVSNLTRQALIVKTISGFDVEVYVNGKFAQRKTTRIDGTVDFINLVVEPGGVTFEVRVVNPDGSVAFSDNRFMHILGAPSKIKINFNNNRVEADGLSALQGTAKVYDKWGYVIPNDVYVTIFSDSGTITTADADPTQTGIQIRVVNGAAEFTYQAGSSAGIAKISASVGQVSEIFEVNLDTPKEPFTLIGLATGKGGMYSAKGNRSVLANDKSFPNGLDGDGRLAVYARGTVMEEWLLTASFDSDRKNRSKFFRELDPDYLYSIYGDNSMLYYDIQTNRNLYVKIERNQTYGLFGDFNTSLMGQEFISYNRTLNGLKIGHQDKQWNVTTFGSLTDRKAVQVELRGQGLSGFYNLGYIDITPGSEKIRIETRDRFHSEILLRTEDRFRFSDYDIDYEQGTVFFKQPVPSVDHNGNPVYIMVSFEAVTGIASSYIAGARVENKFFENLSVGITGVTEEQSPKNFTLIGTDAKYQMFSNLLLSGEFARSNNLGGAGYAYKAETRYIPFENLNLNGYYRNVEKGFTNVTQIGGMRELGTQKYGISGDYRFTPFSKVFTEYFHTTQNNNAGGNNVVNSITGGIEHRFMNNLSGQLKTDTSQPALSTQSTLASAKVDYKMTERLIFSALHERNLGSENDRTRPNATSLLGEYKATETITLQAQEKFYEDGGMLSTIGATTTIFENTQAYGKYEIGNAIGNYRNQISIGLNNKVKLTDDLTGYLGYEKTKGLGQRLGEAQTNDHTAYSAAVEYLPKAPIKVTTKVEFGENSNADKTNFTFAGDYHFERDFSLILKYRSSDESSKRSSNYRTLIHLITGIAYRPVDVDWINAIAKYEVKKDKNHFIAPFIDYATTIISVHTFIEPIQRLEFGIKYAFKNALENSTFFSATTNTNFYLLRAEYDITDDWSAGAEYRLLQQLEAGDKLDGYCADINYAVIQNVRLSVGYNFKGYKERDLVDYALWSHGPFIKVNWKFTETTFGW